MQTTPSPQRIRSVNLLLCLAVAAVAAFAAFLLVPDVTAHTAFGIGCACGSLAIAIRARVSGDGVVLRFANRKTTLGSLLIRIVMAVGVLLALMGGLFAFVLWNVEPARPTGHVLLCVAAALLGVSMVIGTLSAPDPE